jgi:hypothetical protein
MIHGTLVRMSNIATIGAFLDDVKQPAEFTPCMCVCLKIGYPQFQWII